MVPGVVSNHNPTNHGVDAGEGVILQPENVTVKNKISSVYTQRYRLPHSLWVHTSKGRLYTVNVR